MNRYLLLLVSVGMLAALGWGAYLSGRQGAIPQYKAIAVAKDLRGSFQADKNNIVALDASWSQVDALLKQQGPSANVRVTSAIVEAYKYYRKTNNAWDPRYQAVNPMMRKYLRQIADAWVDVADAILADDKDLSAMKQGEIENLHRSMKAEVDRIDPQYFAERWQP
jgi:hypothetical protein